MVVVVVEGGVREEDVKMEWSGGAGCEKSPPF